MINQDPEKYVDSHPYSVVMDENHLLNAFAYISLNLVRAGLVERAQDWKWSSVNAHLTGKLTA